MPGKSKRFPLIFLVGDVHGQFRHVIEAVKSAKPDAVLFLGDFEAQRPLEDELAPILDVTEVRFIHGNHDTDSQLQHANVFRSSLAHLNVHGRVDTICGLRVAGLGGVFRKEVWFPKEGGAPLHRSHQALITALDQLRPQRDRSSERSVLSKRERTHLSSIFPDDIQKLERQKADLLITHEAPSCHPNGFAVLDRLGRAMGVEALFHGHHHDRRDYRAQWPDVGFKVYGVGLRGISTLQNEAVVPSIEDAMLIPDCRPFHAGSLFDGSKSSAV